ncbi:hypothetical protein ACFYY8_33435 [Streptosporangium sp. NPDC001559]|uniref:hypothetical protein n=1 Tax=Streptosporangium sp. NPDC001559 TaxID=3366187 RepID=UPI0036E3FD42
MENHTSIGDGLTLGRLRAALAKIDHLPDNTPVLRGEDDGNEPDSYAQIKDLEVAYWDGETQHPAGRLSLFIW